MVQSERSKLVPSLSSLISLILKVKALSPLEFTTTALFVSRSWYRRVKGLSLGCMRDLSWFLVASTWSLIVHSRRITLILCSISMVVVSSWSNSYGRASPGVGGVGSAVSSARICGWSHTSFHLSPATVAFTSAGVIGGCSVLAEKRCSRAVGWMLVDS